MVTTVQGLVTLETRSHLVGIYKTMITKGLAEVRDEQNFVVLLSNFGPVEQHWTKGMIVEYAIKIPLVLSTIGGDFGLHLEKCLNIPQYNGLDLQRDQSVRGNQVSTF